MRALIFWGKERKDRTRLKGEAEVEHCGMFWMDWLLR